MGKDNAYTWDYDPEPSRASVEVEAPKSQDELIAEFLAELHPEMREASSPRGMPSRASSCVASLRSNGESTTGPPNCRKS